MTIKRRRAIQGLIALILKIQQILLVGTQVRAITKVLRELMQGICILHIMKVMVDSKRKLTERSSGSSELLTESKLDQKSIRNNIGDVLKISKRKDSGFFRIS